MKDLTYKGYVIAINELPNFISKNELYRGMSQIDSVEWVRDAFSIEDLIEWFKSYVDNLYRNMTYEKLIKLWGSRYKKIDYKGRWLSITARKRAKDNKVVYLGEFCSKDYRRSKSIESINYDKVVSKFERFVDEYCTDWRTCSSIPYKGYMLWIDEEYEGENFFGVCEIHKNSKFKCISKSYREIEERFIARIDQVVYHKQEVKNVNSKEEKIKQLEAQIAKLQQELEKVKNEKEIYVYKGVTLEYSKEEGLQEGYMIGKIKNAPEGTKEFYRKVAAHMQTDFEEYIDELESATNIYLELTGQEFYIPEKHDY